VTPAPRHRYGDRVHLVGDVAAATLLAQLCTPSCTQPDFSRSIRRLYERLFWAAAGLLPRARQTFETRMRDHTPRAVLDGEFIALDARVVVVDVARAGILPAQVFYDLANELLDPEHVRQDHLIMARRSGPDGGVTGAEMLGGKVGGRVDGATVFIPDPMGATGVSVRAVIDHYLEAWGTPSRVVAVNLIVTPEYLRAMSACPVPVEVVALRVDRGLSAPDVLACVPGERWADEVGVNEHGYIVPGGGGFGEIMNNSWV
jgi:uracil phosphoribosyltransferase